MSENSSIGRPHRHFAHIGSTNEAALVWGREEAPHGALVTADEQTSGRGRRGRTWNSPAGKGLYLSLVVRPGADLALVPRLTMLAALAAVEAVQQVAGARAHTKWPNDVLLNGRKIAGVLCEAEMREGALLFAVVGLGLNVNLAADDLPPRPIFPASSLLIETGRSWPIEAVREVWLQAFEVLFSRVQRGEWSRVRNEFARRCAGMGQVVRIKDEGAAFEGTAIGIADDGALLVQTTGELRRVVAGDVDFFTTETPRAEIFRGRERKRA